MASKSTGPGTDVSAVLERLSRIKPGRNRVVTCYLKLEPRDRVRHKYLIKLKNRLKKVAETLPSLNLARTAQEAVLEDFARIEDYLKSPGNLPTTQGVALFVCGPANLFEVVPLPSVHRSRIVVDRSPLVRELASVSDEYGTMLTVVADRSLARLFEVTAFGANEVKGFSAGNTRGKRFSSHGRRGEGTYGEHTYHNRIREEKARHFESVARSLFSYKRGQAVHGVVLAGPGKDASAIEPFLHPYVAGRVMGSVKLNPKTATASEVHQRTIEVRQQWERDSERKRVDEMTDAIGNGWAVNGLPGTLRRLARGQVRTLLVDPESAVPGFKCEESGRLTQKSRECSGEGGAIPVVDLVDEAIEEALRQHVKVDVVYEPQARKKIEGIAGILRFK